MINCTILFNEKLFDISNINIIPIEIGRNWVLITFFEEENIIS